MLATKKKDNSKPRSGDYRRVLPQASVWPSRPSSMTPHILALPMWRFFAEGSAFPSDIKRMAAFSLYLIFLFNLPKMVVMRVSIEDCFWCFLVAIAVLGISVSLLGEYLANRSNSMMFGERRRNLTS